MKKLATLATAFAIVGASVLPGTAMAAIPYKSVPSVTVGQASSGQQMVWVAKDVTKQQGYTVEYKTYDNLTGKLLQDKIVAPSAGSLVQYRQETLAQAKADGLDYIIPSSTQTLAKQLDQLHQTVYKRLNSSMTAQPSVSSLTVYPNSTTTASSNIITGFDSGDVHYSVTYSDGTYGSVNVSGFSTYQGSGSGRVYQTEIDWDGSSYSWSNPAPLVPTSSSSALTHSMSWNGSTGYQFNDNLVSDSFMGWNYSGYITIN